MHAIVEAEIAEKRLAAEEYDQLGQSAQAAGLRAQADVLDAHLSA
jgi:hypothetical protein